MIKTIAAIRLTSEFNSSIPDKWYYDKDLEFREYHGPTTQNTGMTLARTSKTVFAVNNGKNQLVPREFVIIPANGLRGAIRHFSAARMFSSLRRRGEEITFRLAHIMLCGAASASPAKTTISFDQAGPSRRHPFVGLWGGGPVLIPSTLKVGNGTPVCSLLKDGDCYPTTLPDVVKETVISHPDNLLGYIFTSRKDDMITASGRAPMDIITNSSKELISHIAMLAESQKNKGDAAEAKKAAKEAKAMAKEKGKQPTVVSADPETAEPAAVQVAAKDNNNKKTSLLTPTYREYAIPGVWFVSRQNIDDEISGIASVGCYLRAMCDFANGQSLGGCGRVGYGQFELTLELETKQGKVLALKNINGNYTVDDTIPYVAEAVAAWDKIENSITGAQLRDLFFTDLV